jgi:hypothetical protein
LAASRYSQNSSAGLADVIGSGFETPSRLVHKLAPTGAALTHGPFDQPVDPLVEIASGEASQPRFRYGRPNRNPITHTRPLIPKTCAVIFNYFGTLIRTQH